MKNKFICYTLTAALCMSVLAGCGCGKGNSDVVEVETETSGTSETAVAEDDGETVGYEDQDFQQMGYDGYQEIVDFITTNRAASWSDNSPTAMNLPYELTDMSRNFGYLINDLDGDGTQELLIGEQCEGDIPVKIFRLYTVGDGGEVKCLYASETGTYMYLNNSNTYIVVDENIAAEETETWNGLVEDGQTLSAEDAEEFIKERNAYKESLAADEAAKMASAESVDAEILATMESDEEYEEVQGILTQGAYTLSGGTLDAVVMPTDLSALQYSMNMF